MEIGFGDHLHVTVGPEDLSGQRNIEPEGRLSSGPTNQTTVKPAEWENLRTYADQQTVVPAERRTKELKPSQP